MQGLVQHFIKGMVRRSSTVIESVSTASSIARAFLQTTYIKVGMKLEFSLQIESPIERRSKISQNRGVQSTGSALQRSRVRCYTNHPYKAVGLHCPAPVLTEVDRCLTQITNTKVRSARRQSRSCGVSWSSRRALFSRAGRSAGKNVRSAQTAPSPAEPMWSS